MTKVQTITKLVALTGETVGIPADIMQECKEALERDENKSVLFVLTALAKGQSQKTPIPMACEYDTNKTFFLEGASSIIKMLEELYGR